MNVAKSQQRQEIVCSEIMGARKAKKNKKPKQPRNGRVRKKSLKRKLLPFFQFVFFFLSKDLFPKRPTYTKAKEYGCQMLGVSITIRIVNKVGTISGTTLALQSV